MQTTFSTFQTNTFGPIRMIQAVVPHMIERRSGLVINLSSIVARL
jgi:NADP-dependent 3-hydroxy acid dehydrogenase YdfG